MPFHFTSIYIWIWLASVRGPVTVQLLVRIEPCDNLFKPPKATAIIIVIFVRIRLCNYISLSYSFCIAGPFVFVARCCVSDRCYLFFFFSSFL